MRKMRGMKRIASLMLALCMMFSMSITVFATSNETSGVAAAREGVLEIRVVAVEQNGTEHVLQLGSGFLVGASTGATTVITNHHVVSVDAETKDIVNQMNAELKIQVIVKRDVVIDATYVNGSATTDFAILELTQAIYDRKPLKLSNSDNVTEAQDIYALGFPSAASEIQDDRVYTSEDVTITNGIVSKFQTVDGINHILHNVQLSGGNSGGPLVNKAGNVVGVNRMVLTSYEGHYDSSYYYSISINEIRGILDALGIYYETDEGTTETEPVTETESVTPEEPVTPAEPDTSAEQVTPTEPAEEVGVAPAEPEKDNTMLIVGVVAVVAVIGVVVVIVMMSKKKKTPAGGVSANQGQQPMPPYPPTQVSNVPPMNMDTGAGETSVLGAGAGETSVLGGGMQPQATLTRKKNGEKAVITSAVFTIGKERQKVNFCIPDNTSISRTHAKILCKGGVFYIVDNNSTNYTFINGNKINPGQEIKLNSGDKIKLADEEFEFRL